MAADVSWRNPPLEIKTIQNFGTIRKLLEDEVLLLTTDIHHSAKLEASEPRWVKFDIWDDPIRQHIDGTMQLIKRGKVNKRTGECGCTIRSEISGARSSLGTIETEAFPLECPI